MSYLHLRCYIDGPLPHLLWDIVEIPHVMALHLHPYGSALQVNASCVSKRMSWFHLNLMSNSDALCPCSCFSVTRFKPIQMSINSFALHSMSDYSMESAFTGPHSALHSQSFCWQHFPLCIAVTLSYCYPLSLYHQKMNSHSASSFIGVNRCQIISEANLTQFSSETGPHQLAKRVFKLREKNLVNKLIDTYR